MISRLNKILQGIRDAFLLVFSIVIMPTSYGKWVVEPAHYILFGIAAFFLVLTVINVILLLLKVKRKGYFYFNAIIQLIPAFLLTILLIVPVIVLILDILIIITLREKRT